MQNLHHQVLCPTIGWTSNFHCYSFRRVHRIAVKITDEVEKYSEEIESAMDMMEGGCWIGPKKSTAVDCMFMPLYIGGAMANDKKIKLGELFIPNEEDEMYLQYIHDFGDFWSHTIRVSKFDGKKVPKNPTVAHILSGSGGCPPENSGGIEKYVTAIKRLTVKIDLEEDDKADSHFISANVVDPTNERWCKLLNYTIRRQHNGVALSNPIEFNLEKAHAKLETTIHRPNQAIGDEMENAVTRDLETGLALEKKQTKDIASENQKDTKKSCAVCGVIVALKLCSACKSIAFCSREHQVKY